VIFDHRKDAGMRIDRGPMTGRAGASGGHPVRKVPRYHAKVPP